MSTLPMSELVFFLIKLLSYIPFRMLYALSDMLYFPFYFLVRYRRGIVRRNLIESFPEKSIDEIIDIEKKFYHFFIDVALETCKLATISPEEMRRRVTFSGVERMHKLFDEGKSIATYLGHYGNWEWLSSTGLWLPETRVAQIYRKLSNKTMDQVMMVLRQRMGNECIERHDTVRYMTTGVKEGKKRIIGFIADQTPRKKESKHFVPFLNHMALAFTGTEKAAKHYDYATMFIDVRRVRRGYYECEFLSLAEDAKSLPDYELTRLFFSRLEEEIRRQPELYLWSHNRFRNAYIIQKEKEQTTN